MFVYVCLSYVQCTNSLAVRGQVKLFVFYILRHRVGQNHKYTVYIYVVLGREIAKHTVIHGVYIWLVNLIEA